MAQESLHQIIMASRFELEAQARCMALTLKRPPEILLLARCTWGSTGTQYAIRVPRGMLNALRLLTPAKDRS